METGIFIRAQIGCGSKWETVDIADSRLDNLQVLDWLRSRGGKNVWAENVVLALLGREQIAREDK